jgi:hypothetical protein
VLSLPFSGIQKVLHKGSTRQEGRSGAKNKHCFAHDRFLLQTNFGGPSVDFENPFTAKVRSSFVCL